MLSNIPTGSGPEALCVCVPGERHEVGLLSSAVILRTLGFRLTYLGSDLPTEELMQVLDNAAATGQVLALLKLGRRWNWVQPLLKQRGLLQQALFAERVGWPDQQVCSADAAEAEPRPYFSLLLIRQGWPEVLP